MKYLVIFNFILAFIGIDALAQSPTPTPSTSLGTNSQLEIFDRSLSGGKPSNSILLRGSMTGWIKLGPSGCLKAMGTVMTGQKYAAPNDVIWSNDETVSPDLNLNLRHVYIDANCVNKNLRLQFGAIPATSEGKLGLSNVGWIDGGKVSYKAENLGQTWAVSFGQVGPIDQPNAIKRLEDYNFNHYDLEVTQTFLDKNKIIFRIGSFENVTFTRAALAWSLEKYVEWLKEAYAEFLWSSNGGLQGQLQEIDFEKGQWKFRLFRTNLDELTPNQSIRSQAKFFYGKGTNYYLFTSRDLDPCHRWTAFGRSRTGSDVDFLHLGISRSFGRSANSSLAPNCK